MGVIVIIQCILCCVRIHVATVARKMTHMLLISRVQLLFLVLYLSLISLVRLCVNDSEFNEDQTTFYE